MKITKLFSKSEDVQNTTSEEVLNTTIDVVSDICQTVLLCTVTISATHFLSSIMKNWIDSVS